jgi:hypothetical protein
VPDKAQELEIAKFWHRSPLYVRFVVLQLMDEGDILKGVINRYDSARHEERLPLDQ